METLFLSAFSFCILPCDVSVSWVFIAIIDLRCAWYMYPLSVGVSFICFYECYQWFLFCLFLRFLTCVCCSFTLCVLSGCATNVPVVDKDNKSILCLCAVH